MTAASVLAGWPDAIEAVLAAPFRRATVLAETDSTQDAARRNGARPGDVIVTGRQRCGRGRLGRAWADTGEEGIAVSFVVEPADPERIAIASAIAAARACEASLGRPVGIKWPNDVVVDDRKLAGVLVERDAWRAIVGIGMNVGQRRWPPELADRAVSLAELGAVVDRLEVVTALVAAMSEALALDAVALAAAFAARDVLSGAPAAFRCRGTLVRGVVRRVDPLHGIEVMTETGPVVLSAALTTVERGG